MTPRPPSRRLAAAWLREVGVDWYLPSPRPADEGEGRGGASVAPAGAKGSRGAVASPDLPQGEVAARPAAVAAPVLAPGEVAARAAGAATLESLREEALACRACPLRKGATQVVFSRGSGRARILFVGEGPGEEEDRLGEPFVGKAGKLLDRWIGRLGLDREDVYVANVVKCRPPGNRVPEPAEAAACLPWLHRQFRLLRPDVVCTLGGTALKHLLGVQEGITRVRGKWLEYEGTPVLPVYHPAYILRNPRAEEEVLADFDLLAARLSRR